ncbi:MAG: hypothetical protein IPK53_09125 [bacterium]|nr:hypothetical protein [bacterium]
MNNEDDKALVPVEQRDIDFYGDVITAVMAEVDGGWFISHSADVPDLGIAWLGKAYGFNATRIWWMCRVCS